MWVLPVIENNCESENSDQMRLSRILKIFWISLITVPVLWTIGCMIIPFGNGQNLAGVLVFLGYFVILAVFFLATTGIAIFVLFKRKSLIKKQIVLGLLPLFLLFFVVFFLVSSSI